MADVGQNERIAQLLQARISETSGHPVTVETVRTAYEKYGADNKSNAGIAFKVKDPARENNPAEMERVIMAALRTIDPLKPHIQTETEACHMKRLAQELEGFIAQEAALNEKSTGERFSTIPKNTPKWFEELPKRNDSSVKHGLNIEKKNTGVVSAAISIPSDVDSAIIVKNIEDRKTAILEMLADRVIKYTPGLDTQEKKDALKAKVKQLELIVSADEQDNRKKVIIQFMSELQVNAVKAPGGFDPEKMAEYVASNPLTVLENGEDDKDKTKPQPHLQKALSRAVLFAGDTAKEIFPLIAGKEDMARAIGKSLTGLKNRANDPALSTKIDGFLGDAVFKNPAEWGKPVEERPDMPSPVVFSKDTTDTPANPYEKGVMEVTFQLPGDKYPDITAAMAELASWSPDAPTVRPATAPTAETPQPVVQQQAPVQPADKPPIAVGSTVITPKPQEITPQLAASFLEQVKRDAAKSGMQNALGA